MKNIKIGIPKALLYYKYQYLWKSFFNELNIDVETSGDTNKSIIDNGTKLIVDESCLALKIFVGHVNELKDKCDYILIPRIETLQKKEKLCTNFLALYDLCNTIFDINILEFNIDVEKGINEIDAFIEMGRTLGIGKIKSIKAYYKAKENYKKTLNTQKLKQEIMLKSTKDKILIVGHPYNLHDEFIGKPIAKYLEKNNTIPILTDLYTPNNYDYLNISTSNYWTFNKELLGAISHYKDKVDGIIIVTCFPCGPDSLSNEMITRKIKDVPIITLIIDELNNDSGIITRLESFTDIIKLKRGDKFGRWKNNLIPTSRRLLYTH